MKSEENKKEVKETENKVVKQGSDDLAEVKKALKKACDVCAAKIKEEYSGLKEEVKGLRSDYGDKVKIALAAYILLIALLVFVAVRLGNGSDTYVAGNSGSVQAYYVSDQAMRQSGLIQSSETYQVTRGTAVKRLSEKMKIGDDTYIRIKDSAAPLRRAIGFLKRGAAISACPDYQYISEASLTDNINDVVRETEVYVRTPATIYKTADSPAFLCAAGDSARTPSSGKRLAQPFWPLVGCGAPRHAGDRFRNPFGPLPCVPPVRSYSHGSPDTGCLLPAGRA